MSTLYMNYQLIYSFPLVIISKLVSRPELLGKVAQLNHLRSLTIFIQT